MSADDAIATMVVDHAMTGRPIVESGQGRAVTIFCPRRHVLASVRASDWAGSLWEARAGDPRYIVTCDENRCGATDVS